MPVNDSLAFVLTASANDIYDKNQTPHRPTTLSSVAINDRTTRCLEETYNFITP